MIISYLNWTNLKHYLNDFIDVFSSLNDYNSTFFDQLMTILEVSIKSFKNLQDTIISIFDIEMNIDQFIARLFSNKLTRVIEYTRLVLKKTFITLLDMQSLMKFLSFCSQAVRLDRVFMRRLWDFMTYDFLKFFRIMKRRISQW
jgi:hypothetical protein